MEEETALNEVCCDLRRFHEQLRDHSDLIAAGVCLSNRGLLAWRSDIRRAIYLFFFRGRFCSFLAPGSMLSCFSDFLLLYFFASLLTLLLCFSCFSAFCFPLLLCFSAFLLFLLLSFSASLFSLLLCFCTSVPFYFYYSTVSSSRHVFLLLYFLLLCFFASCLYCLFVFHFLLLYSVLFVS